MTPSQGELLSESENGTLIKIGFTPNSYGKTYQSQLIISVNKNKNIFKKNVIINIILLNMFF